MADIKPALSFVENFKFEWNEVTSYLKKYQQVLDKIYICPNHEAPKYVYYKNWRMKKEQIEEKRKALKDVFK